MNVRALLALSGALLVLGCHPPREGQTTRPDGRPATALEIPALRGQVNDDADLLTPEQEAELAEFYASLEQKVGCQMALLTIDSVHGASIEEYSLQVANAWALGRRGIDDGILITVARTEKAFTIEVGAGLKLLIPEQVAQQIAQRMQPDFSAGRFFKALEQGSLELVHLIRAHQDLVGKKRP